MKSYEGLCLYDPACTIEDEQKGSKRERWERGVLQKSIENLTPVLSVNKAGPVVANTSNDSRSTIPIQRCSKSACRALTLCSTRLRKIGNIKLANGHHHQLPIDVRYKLGTCLQRLACVSSVQDYKSGSSRD